MKDNKQSFVDLGSKQKELERNEKSQINHWADKNKGLEHQTRNQAREDWDHMRNRAQEGLDHVKHRAQEGMGKKGRP